MVVIGFVLYGICFGLGLREGFVKLTVCEISSLFKLIVSCVCNYLSHWHVYGTVLDKHSNISNDTHVTIKIQWY
jgi:hypothetical protein